MKPTPLWGKPVDEVDTVVILAVLQPLWQRIPETASRLRGRIEAVLDFAKAHKLRSGENPAAWRGHLALILPKRQKLSRGHHAAMAYSELPGFMARLRKSNTVTALALEFLVLTAARSGEVRGACWSEIDLDAKVWSIPASRMSNPHRVPLSGPAVAILASLGEARLSDFLFFGRRLANPISPMAMTKVLRRMNVKATVHGFRSTIRDWCGNETNFPREIAEHALAHATGSAVELAYRRGDALEKRLRMVGILRAIFKRYPMSRSQQR